MEIRNSVAFVSGANRGLGRRLVDGLLTRGANKVYAAARKPELIEVDDPRIVPIAFDVTDQHSIDTARDVAQDVTLLINNAGVLAFGNMLDADFAGIENDLRTNYLGTLRSTRAFVSVIEANGGGTIANVLTLIALAPINGMAGYSASKAAAHSMTQSLRAELRGRNIHVVGAYPGGMDTDMLAGVDAEKAPPEEVAASILDGIAAGETTIFPDATSAGAGDVWRRDPLELEVMLSSW